jgi:hypothetical protein
MINIIRDDSEVYYVLGLLNTAFKEATINMGKPSRLAEINTFSKQLYNWQVDYSYFIHDITTSPRYIVSKLVNNCFSFIESIEKERNLSILL